MFELSQLSLRAMFIIHLVFVILIFPSSISAATCPTTKSCSTVCCGTTCGECDVGPFMQGISAACGNKGDCTLVDIMSVVANIGNWILGIVALVVFVIYIYGGIKILMGGAKPDFVAQGKTAIKTATVGLVIVFVANLGLTSIEKLLKTGNISGGGGTVAECTMNTVGQSCDDGDNKVCSKEGGCASECLYRHGRDSVFMCMIIPADLTETQIFSSCEKDLCPGGDLQLCCAKPAIDRILEERSQQEQQETQQFFEQNPGGA